MLLSLYGSSLYSDHLQFGFKANSGCNDAMFTFIESATVRSLYLTMFQAIGAIDIIYELAPPSLGRPDPLSCKWIGRQFE